VGKRHFIRPPTSTPILFPVKSENAFPEEEYLDHNPDVAAAIRAGG
jgi:hypothetical protein